jgi:hypothetical protein
MTHSGLDGCKPILLGLSSKYCYLENTLDFCKGIQDAIKNKKHDDI